MGKKQTFIVSLLVILVGIGGYFFLINQINPYYEPEGDQTRPSPAPTPEPKKIVKLETYVEYASGNWYRGTEDLPYYSANFEYTVSNQGNSVAKSVSIQCFRDDIFLYSTTVDISSNTYFKEQIFNINMRYDDSSTIKVTATYQDQIKSDSVTLYAELSRYQSEMTSLFITPNDPVIIQLRNEIVKNALVHWMAIRNWVGNNIEYEYDSVQFNKDEYWLLGRETYNLKNGDCEDQAILLCSLLRADGYDPDEVFVILGTVDAEGHAWVSVKILSVLGKPIWINLEPTADGFIVSQFSDLESLLNEVLGNTERTYRFNDVFYKEYS